MMDEITLFVRASVAGACTKYTCPASASIYGYAPNKTANLFFTGFFGLTGLVFYYQNFLWPQWGAFSLACGIGAWMEAGGYVGRLLLSNDPFSDMGFKLNIILLTVAPAFISASIYLTLKRSVIVFGRRFSRMPPAWYAYVFVGCDVVSIILQGAGGAISAIATEKTLLDQGVDIMIAGLTSQVFTLMIFFGLCIDFFVQCSRNRHDLNPGTLEMVKTRRFQVFAVAVMVAFLCIFTRCCYRVAELSKGWGSELMRKESEFIVLDSGMCTFAWLLMHVFHPGYFFQEPIEQLPDERVGSQEMVAPTKGMHWKAEDEKMGISASKQGMHWKAEEMAASHHVCHSCGHREGNWI